jgi:hypothetical protein
VATVRATPTPDTATSVPILADPGGDIEPSAAPTTEAPVEPEPDGETLGRVTGAFDAPIVPAAASGRFGRRRRSSDEEVTGANEPSDADIVAALPDDFGGATEDAATEDAAAQDAATVSDADTESGKDDTPDDQAAAAHEPAAPTTGTFDATPLPEEPKRRFGRRGDR